MWHQENKWITLFRQSSQKQSQWRKQQNSWASRLLNVAARCVRLCCVNWNHRDGRRVQDGFNIFDVWRLSSPATKTLGNTLNCWLPSKSWGWSGNVTVKLLDGKTIDLETNCSVRDTSYLETTGVAKQAVTCFLDAAVASTEEISIYYIPATAWTPPAFALSNAESHFVLLGNITVTQGSKVLHWKFQILPQSSVERAAPESWLRCSGKNNHQQGEERIWLLERQVAVSWKSFSRAVSQCTSEQREHKCICSVMHGWMSQGDACSWLCMWAKEKVSRHNKSDAHLFSLACWEEPMRGSRFSDITSRLLIFTVPTSEKAVLSSG